MWQASIPSVCDKQDDSRSVYVLLRYSGLIFIKQDKYLKTVLEKKHTKAVDLATPSMLRYTFQKRNNYPVQIQLTLA